MAMAMPWVGHRQKLHRVTRRQSGTDIKTQARYDSDLYLPTVRTRSAIVDKCRMMKIAISTTCLTVKLFKPSPPLRPWQSRVADKGTPSGRRPASPEGKRRGKRGSKSIIVDLFATGSWTISSVASPLGKLPVGLMRSLRLSHAIAPGFTGMLISNSSQILESKINYAQHS